MCYDMFLALTSMFQYTEGGTHTQENVDIIKYYNPSIWKLIQGTLDPSPPPLPIINVNPPYVPPQPIFLETYKGFSLGDTVRVIGCKKCYAFCRDSDAYVRKIYKNGHVYFFVEMCDSDLRKRGEQLSFPCIYSIHSLVLPLTKNMRDTVDLVNNKESRFKGQDKNWIYCKTCQILKKPQTLVSSLGKRSADEMKT